MLWTAKIFWKTVKPLFRNIIAKHKSLIALLEKYTYMDFFSGRFSLVFSQNTRKYEQEKTTYLETFQVV